MILPCPAHLGGLYSIFRRAACLHPFALVRSGGQDPPKERLKVAKQLNPRHTIREWPEIMIVPPAWKMDAELLKKEVERLVQMFKAHPESRSVEVSKIILGGKWDADPESRELILYLRTTLPPEEVAAYQTALEEGPLVEWLQTLPDPVAEKFVQWRFGFEVQSELPRGKERPKQ